MRKTCTVQNGGKLQGCVRGLGEAERSITLLSFIIKRLQRKGRVAETHTL